MAVECLVVRTIREAKILAGSLDPRSPSPVNLAATECRVGGCVAKVGAVITPGQADVNVKSGKCVQGN